MFLNDKCPESAYTDGICLSTIGVFWTHSRVRSLGCKIQNFDTSHSAFLTTHLVFYTISVNFQMIKNNNHCNNFEPTLEPKLLPSSHKIYKYSKRPPTSSKYIFSSSLISLNVTLKEMLFECLTHKHYIPGLVPPWSPGDHKIYNWWWRLSYSTWLYI